MALSEFENKKYEKAVKAFIAKNRPPAHIRKELDLSYRLKGQSVEIFETRPRRDNPKEIMESPVAKATYVKTQGIWKIYWQRADLKWHSYQPYPEAKTIEEFLDVVETDSNACFFG
ncbi:MAG: hypothetical protein DIZ78_08115 [endosymbiont of Escarpia spicata]|uniref:DUF3024 domain-containing protein n=1 Tax=endosymbiont of Escarpia spicata TaxID=2200908 RepID=A0A370DRR5_9GAMM|nr:MAG: hypothetical protein DIZ78_08115 [endosymbiont of Escarpia spicata]